MVQRLIAVALATFITISAPAAQALEYPIGRPQFGGGMEVAAVYQQKPATVSPAGLLRPVAKSDIHIEADIHALADNPNGFAEGDWMPELTLSYDLRKKGTSAPFATGKLVQLLASDGPHYGQNVKMQGPGKYVLTLHIAPPPANAFGRNTSKKGGVGKWFKPFALQYPLTFAGVKK